MDNNNTTVDSDGITQAANRTARVAGIIETAIKLNYQLQDLITSDGDQDKINTVWNQLDDQLHTAKDLAELNAGKLYDLV